MSSTGADKATLGSLTIPEGHYKACSRIRSGKGYPYPRNPRGALQCMQSHSVRQGLPLTLGVPEGHYNACSHISECNKITTPKGDKICRRWCLRLRRNLFFGVFCVFFVFSLFFLLAPLFLIFRWCCLLLLSNRPLWSSTSLGMSPSGKLDMRAGNPPPPPRPPSFVLAREWDYSSQPGAHLRVQHLEGHVDRLLKIHILQ